MWVWKLLLLLAFTGLLRPLDAQFSPEWSVFDTFMTKFGKPYRDNETSVLERFRIFQESLRRQAVLNAYEAENGGTAVYGVTKFSDLTPQEFKSVYLSSLKPSPVTAMSRSDPVRLFSLTEDLPTKFDWRKSKVVTPVRNQKRCGSCWAFAVVETIESRYAIQYGDLYWLSPQQLISCERGPGLDGCAGGILASAFHTLKQSQTTIVLDSSYPFESGDGQTHSCKGSLPNVGVQLKDYHFNESLLNETEMKVLLSKYSPLTTSVNALGWQDYAGGIIQHHCTGEHQYIDHAVQVVGYNMNGSVPYWIVRNTWGTDWGENGYVRLKYGSNMCGVAQEVGAVLDVTGVNLSDSVHTT